MSDGIEIDYSNPLMIEGCSVNGKPQDAVIIYKDSKITFTGDRSNGAFDEFKKLLKQIKSN